VTENGYEDKINFERRDHNRPTMAASSSSSISSCSPSSSAVTIPVAGKSILKRPPQAQASIFSRITRFLPTQTQPHATPIDDAKPLKRAHFILPQIATVYPISSINPPSTPTLKEEKRAIEDREQERRKRVVRGNSTGSPEGRDLEEWWSMDKVESFYRECCAGCEEEPDAAITVALKVRKQCLKHFLVVRAPICSACLTIESKDRRLLWCPAYVQFGVYPVGCLQH